MYERFHAETKPARVKHGRKNLVNRKNRKAENRGFLIVVLANYVENKWISFGMEKFYD